MALFNILEAPDGKPDRVMVIREGFSPGAFIFTVFWALWHRMWVVAAILFAILAAVSLAAGLVGLSPTLTSVLEAAVSLIFGFEATRLRTVSSERAGYRLVGQMEASNQEAAELQYFMGRQRPSSAVRAPVLPAASHDTLGLFGNV